MKKRHVVQAIAAMLAVSSCVEEYDVAIPNSELVVIDALLADADSVSTVFVRLSGETSGQMRDDNYPALDADVTLSDDAGHEWKYTDLGGGRKHRLEYADMPAGRHYTLTVRVGDKTYSATEYMCPAPEVKDLKFYYRKTWDESLWCPILFFSDRYPNEENYYLFTDRIRWVRNDYAQQSPYLMYLSDEGLRENLNGIRISLGMGADAMDKGIGLMMGDEYHYEFYTISKRNYEFYRGMESQITNDGGVYKPNPSNLLTNFSGDNVVGQFVVSSMVVLEGRVTRKNTVKE